MDVLLTTGLAGLTWLTLLGGWRMRDTRLDYTPSFGAIALGLLAVGAAVWIFGIAAGLALILTVLVHEYGHVAAFRVAGHSDATFRLIPFFGGVAISRRMPDTRLHDFYITAMGPGICLVLMCGAFTLAKALPEDTTLAEFCVLVGVFSGVLNFFSLLPLWPFDGGKMLHAIVGALSPGAADKLMYAMGVLLLVVALALHSIILFVFGLLSFQSISGSAAAHRELRPMSVLEALHGLAILGLMLAAFYLGGEPILGEFLPRSPQTTG